MDPRAMRCQWAPPLARSSFSRKPSSSTTMAAPASAKHTRWSSVNPNIVAAAMTNVRLSRIESSAEHDGGEHRAPLSRRRSPASAVVGA